ncbi:MAG: carbon-nitrogen hydrolase family protein [Ignavibacteria bacterium]
MKIKVALLQIASHKFDQKLNMEKADLYCRKANALYADIILFPEMWNIGYESFDEGTWKTDFDPESASKKAIEQWYSNSVDTDSEFIDHFRQLAKELNTAIVITFLQKGKDKPYNSAALIDRFGKIVLNYSKVHTCDFSLEYFCESGKEFFVSDLDTRKGIVKTGIMICFDREFPESARELMLLGAELILIPNACMMDTNRNAQLRTRVFENMTGVALANYPSPKCNGRSQAYTPIVYDENEIEQENLLVMAGEDEGIFIAEFDMDKIRNYRQKEVWGNAYRKTGAYKNILSGKVNSPFDRKLNKSN